MNDKIKIGSLIGGRYEILELVGSGGMADVYKARCNKLNRFVAIKFLKKEFLADREFTERFDAEARAAAGITHPNIVSVYDVGETEAGKYIVMEYVEGITLKEYIDRKGALTWREAASVAGQISSALCRAHMSGIIHRDIKPHNIIITKTGSAKVTDFGIARAVSQSTIVKSDGNILGSAHYFSPEQGGGGAVDKRADIYSLGVVMFEMLMGRVPFDNANPLSLAIMHSSSPVPEINADAPEELKKIVYTAMNKNPEDRYSDAYEMLEDIKSVLKGNPLRYTPDKPKKMSKTERTLQKAADEKNTKIINIICIAAIALVVIIILVITIHFVSSWGRDGGEPEVTPTPTEAVDNGEEEDNAPVEVPDVLKRTKEAATEILEEAGFKVKSTDAPTEKESEEGKVIAQQPSAETMWVKGTEITIFVGKLSEPDTNTLTLQKVVGMTEAEAVVLLESAGFKVNVEYRETSDENKVDCVLEQYPLGGEKLSKGSTVGLVVGAEKKEEHALPTPSSTPNNSPTPSAPVAKRENVSFIVPGSADDGEKWVKATVAGVAVLEGTYKPGQTVNVSVSLNPGEKKTVIFYVNDKVQKQVELAY